MRPELGKIGSSGFVNGLVDLLGRLRSDAFHFGQILRACRHHTFDRPEMIKQSTGSCESHFWYARKNIDLTGTLAMDAAPRAPDGNFCCRMKLPCREEDQSRRFIFILGPEDRNAEPDGQGHESALDALSGHACLPPFMGWPFQNKERAPRRSCQSSCLAKQASSPKALEEIPYSLPLQHGLAFNEVISRTKALYGNGYALHLR